jgi:hypothetical protein
MPMPPNNIFDIHQHFRIGDKNECWIWIGLTVKPKPGSRLLPYGRMSLKGKNYRAHRLMYEFFYGVKPGKLLVLHTCDNPRCVKPSHLFLGTHSDNLQDCITKGRFIHGCKRSLETRAKMSVAQKQRFKREREERED